MIRKNLLQLIFSGASIWRWNDKLRPTQLTEIEKQAHKMLIACALWHEATRDQPLAAQQALAEEIIEGALADYFYRLIITDIKPPVFYRIKQNREHFHQLTSYVLGRLEPVLAPVSALWPRLRRWHREEDQTLGRKILAASHLFASRWEFELIRPYNPFDEEMDGISDSFDKELAAYSNLPGMSALMNTHTALARFANLCGQLRFQIRWSQESLIPATSVLGHMFLVAAYAYMFSVTVGSGRGRRANIFFSGLFHDFPELLTRDIISPVKQSIPGLSQLVKEYENSELERRVLTPLRGDGFPSLAERFSWYLGLPVGSEFQDCYRRGHEIVKVADFAALNEQDLDENDPRDGQLLKVCDLLAAFMEAQTSIGNGIASARLLEARGRLKQGLCQMAPRPLHMEALLADFE